MDEASIAGEALFWLGELRERADLALARDFGVGGSADGAPRGAPRGAVMIIGAVVCETLLSLCVALEVGTGCS